MTDSARLAANPFTAPAIAALLFAAGSAFPAAAIAGAQPVGPTPVQTPSETASSSLLLDRAAELLAEDQLVQARAMLASVSRDAGAVSLTDADRERLFRLVRQTERRLETANPLDISLQSAEVAIMNDSLAVADRHLTAVKTSPVATETQAEQARTLGLMLDARRRMMAAKVDRSLQAAARAFAAGDYAEAKTELVRVRNWGVDLSPTQRRTLDGTLGRIQEIELSTGEVFATETLEFGLFDGDAGLAEFQPGVIQTRPWRRAGQPQQNPAQPDTDTGSGSPAIEFTDGSQPDTAESDQPEPEPRPEARPAQPQPPAEDPFQIASDARTRELLERADRAFADRRFAEAVQLYTEALATGRGSIPQGDLTLIQSRLEQARLAQQGGVVGGPEGDPLEQEFERLRLARQQFRLEFDNTVEQAEAAIRTGDLGQARNLASIAGLRLDAVRGVISEAEFEERNRLVEDLLSRINEVQEARQRAEAQERQREIEQRARTAEEQRLLERDQKIIELIDRVRALQEEQNYEAALQEVEQILFLDPNNAAGLVLRRTLSDILLYSRYNRATDRSLTARARATVDNYEATIAPPNIINYPDDWVAISTRRGDPMQFTESAANRAVLATLQDRRTPVNFNDNALEDVIDFLATIGGNVPVDVDWDSLDDIGVSRDSPVTLNLTDVPLQTALDRVLAKVSDLDFPAGWAVYDGVLTIASDEVLRRNTVLEIYDIRDLLIEIRDFDNAPEFDLNAVFQQGGQTGGGGGGGQSPFQQANQDPDRTDLEELIENLVDIIQTNVDPEGWQDAGGTTGAIQEYNGNLIITNTPRNHRAISGLLSQLRAVRNLQINVESRFLFINEEFFEQIGFDIDLYFGGSSNEAEILRTIDPTLSLDDFFAVDEEGAITGPNDVVVGSPSPFTGTAGGATGLPQARFEPGAQGDQFTPIGAPSNSLGLTQTLAGASLDIVGDVLGSAPALAVAGRFLDDVQVDFLVEATQADRRSLTLTAPRVTFTNGQFSYVFVATQTAFISDLVPVVSDSAVAFDPTPAAIPEGVNLEIGGVISADRRYVTLDVDTAIAEAEIEATTTVQAAAGGGGLGGGAAGIAEGEIGLPVFTITRVQTTVTVPDQGTALLGGQRLVEEIETETGVPVLSKIPILNRFFSNRIEAKNEQTLLILIKPTVLIQNEEEERQFPGLLDSLAR